MVDVYSRKIVVWPVETEESMLAAARLVTLNPHTHEAKALMTT
ncbi:hypothetical protein ACMHYB_22555 [Sorangium sp. So ce1128]